MIRRLLIALAAVLVVILLGLGWLTQSQSGLRVLLGLADRIDGVSISFQQLEGKLNGFQAQNVRLELQGLLIHSDQLRLNWRPLALLSSELRIDSLILGSVLAQPDADSLADSPPNSVAEFSLPEMPLLIEIDEFSAAALSWKEQPVTQEIFVKATLNNELWQLHKLQAVLEVGQLQGRGELAAGESLKHQLEFTLNSSTKGELILVANGDRSQSRIQLDQAGVNQLTLLLSDLSRDISWQADFVADSLVSWGLDGDARFKAEGNLETLNLDGEANISGHPILISSLNVQRIAEGFELAVTFALDGLPVELDALLNPDGLKSSVFRIADQAIPSLPLEIEHARFSAAGPWVDLSVKFEGAGLLSGTPWQVNARGGLSQFTQLEIEMLTGSLLQGSLDGQAKLDLSAMVGRISSNLQQLNTAALNPVLPTALNGRLDAVLGAGGAVDIKVSQLAAVISGQQLNGHGGVKLLSGELQEVMLELSAGPDNNLKLSNYDPISKAIRINSKVRNLGYFLPGAKGSLTGNAQLSLQNLSTSGQLDFTQIEAFGVSVQQAELVGDSRDGSNRTNLQASGVRIGQLSLESLAANLAGSPLQHSVLLELIQSPGRSATLRAVGSLEQQDYRLLVNQLNLSDPESFGMLENPNPFKFNFIEGILTLENACLEGEAGRICAAFAGDKTTGSSSISAHLLPTTGLAKLGPMFGLPPLTSAKPINLDGSAHWDQGLLVSASVDGSIDDIVIELEEELLELGNLVLNANGNDNQLAFSARLSQPDGELVFDGNLQQPLTQSLIDGRLRGSLIHLERWSPWLGDIDLREGSADINLAIRGSLNNPVISGNATLSQLVTSIPELNITPTFDLLIDFPAAAQGTISGQLKSGDGSAELKGTIGPRLADGITLSIKGGSILASDSENVSVNASPDLLVRWKNKELAITGQVLVNRALTRLAGLEGTVGGPTHSADIIIVDQRDAEVARTDSWTTSTNLDLVLEFVNPGRIEGYGLQGAVEGRVQIKQSNSGPVLANGELRLAGQYTAFGQTLSIENGRFVYVNTPLENPAVDALASRQVGDIKVGVRISGRPDSLSSRLESEPSMAEADILSYLVLGRPASRSDKTTDESNLLAAAAISLAAKQGSGLVGAVNSRLGGAELNLSDDIGQLALAIGKQFSPRLYISYTVGLLEPIDVVTMRYRINRRLALETELADEARASLKYRIEKN